MKNLSIGNKFVSIQIIVYLLCYSQTGSNGAFFKSREAKEHVTIKSKCNYHVTIKSNNYQIKSKNWDMLSQQGFMAVLTTIDSVLREWVVK